MQLSSVLRLRIREDIVRREERGECSVYFGHIRVRFLRKRIVIRTRLQLAASLLFATVVASGQMVQPDKATSCRPLSRAENSPYQRITGTQRYKWFAQSTIGPQSVAAGVFSAGFGTAVNSPKEYRGTWEGFGERYGMRLTGVSTGNAMEAGFGALWGEDPRYFRATDKPFGGRIRSIIKMTFVARDRSGKLAPAYARYIATAGNNILSDTWRVDSEADGQHAALRTLLGFAGRMGSNAFQEFWPDIRQRVFRKKP
jgi:hypothetical protein